MRNYEKISRGQLTEARDIYQALLSGKTKESDWQKFFSQYPYVLSTTLPLALRSDHIRPMGRNGKADPDFVFYPWDATPIPFYGVIELKRPDSKIVSVTRSNVAVLTTDARTAVEQSKVYVEELGAQLINADRSLILLGNRSYIFVIMGLQQEISQKLGEKLFREQIENQLPRNVQLLPYDTLFNQFEAQIPPLVMFLVPNMTMPDKKEEIEDLWEQLDEETRHYYDSTKCG